MPAELSSALSQIRTGMNIIEHRQSGHRGIGLEGQIVPGDQESPYRLLASLPPLYPEWLGDRSFCETHQTRFPYVTGAMANGIATVEVVIAAAQHGFMGFFGSAGLAPEVVEAALIRLEEALNPHALPWGANLIHSPQEPALEEAIVDLYLRRGVRKVSAAAYMSLTPALVRYAASGIYRDSNGQIVRSNYVFAKISRPEVAHHFMNPPPVEILQALVTAGKLSAEEAELAAQLPVAEDITAESDSGGHTDNRPLGALLPTILRQRDTIASQHNYSRPIRVGAAGGLGTPSALAAAYALGASYVVTGSVNQGCVESGLCSEGKELLAKAGLADVIMAPAADMFEMGVEVQVLRTGTMFANRAKKLYELYRNHQSLGEIAPAEQKKLERDIFRKPISEAWNDTANYWQARDQEELAKANANPKHQMALLFRAYLGQSSRWAINGVAERKLDYQIWCGPAMGAFNQWAKDSFLEAPGKRSVGQVGLNLLEGAALITRAQQIRSHGVAVPSEVFDFRPRPLA